MTDRRSDVEVLLGELAGDLRVPAPGPELTATVLARVAAPAPGRRRTRWAVVVGAVVAALLALGVSPVGAKVAEWLDVGGVMVRDDDTVPSDPSDSPVVPSEAPGSLDGAAFEPLLPAELGPPEGASVGPDGGLVSMTWTVDGETVRLDQFDAGLDPYFWKASPVARHVDVAGRDALWFPVPHEVTVVPAGGAPESHPPRLAGRTLVLPLGELTLRLEGSFGLERAVAILASVEPLR